MARFCLFLCFFFLKCLDGRAGGVGGQSFQVLKAGIMGRAIFAIAGGLNFNMKSSFKGKSAANSNTTAGSMFNFPSSSSAGAGDMEVIAPVADDDAVERLERSQRGEEECRCAPNPKQPRCTLQS